MMKRFISKFFKPDIYEPQSREEFRIRVVKLYLIHIPILAILVSTYIYGVKQGNLVFQLASLLLMMLESLCMLFFITPHERLLDIYSEDERLKSKASIFYFFSPLTHALLTIFLLSKKSTTKKAPLIFRSNSLALAIFLSSTLLQFGISSLPFSPRKTYNPSYWISPPGAHFASSTFEGYLWAIQFSKRLDAGKINNPIKEIEVAYKDRSIDVIAKKHFFIVLADQAYCTLSDKNTNIDEKIEVSLSIVEDYLELERIRANTRPFLLRGNPYIVLSPYILAETVLFTLFEINLEVKSRSVHKLIHRALKASEDKFKTQNKIDPAKSERFKVAYQKFGALKIDKLLNNETGRMIASILEEDDSKEEDRDDSFTYRHLARLTPCMNKSKTKEAI